MITYLKMTSINHEVFITITKYCRPSELKQISTLSKECNDIVQTKVDCMFDLKKELSDWARRWLHSIIKPQIWWEGTFDGKSKLVEHRESIDPIQMDNIYATGVILFKKNMEFDIKNK